MTSKRRTRAALASTAASLLLTVAVGRADTVTLTPDATTKGAAGGLVRGTVVSESAAKVEVKLGNTTTAIPAHEVASIAYDGHPTSLDAAQAKESSNLLLEAADLYKKAAADAAGKPFVAEAATYGQAHALAEYALTDANRSSEAIAVLEQFVRANKNSRHAAAALESLARLQLAREDYKGVESTLASMSALPRGDDRAAIFRVKVLARKGQGDQAVAELDKLIAGAPEGSARRRDAQLAKAENLVQLKKYAEAEATAREVIKAAGAEDDSAQAAAHNALGDCLVAAGKPREALYAYLHTDLLFSDDKEEHPRALARIASLWRVLNRNDRADEAMERLKADYPKSPYATAGAK